LRNSPTQGNPPNHYVLEKALETQAAQLAFSGLNKSMRLRQTPALISEMRALL
jgi:hypothetical protein